MSQALPLSLPSRKRNAGSVRLAVLGLATLAGGALYLRALPQPARSVKTVPVAEASAPSSSLGRSSSLGKAPVPTTSTTSSGADILTSTLTEYRAGHWQQAQVQANAVLTASAIHPELRVSTAGKVAPVLRARRILAFAAARQRDLKTAQTQFAQLAQEAAPAKGATTLPAAPTFNASGIAPLDTPQALREDALYQHAVCTAALGDKAGAEREWITLMRQYPESPLVHASVKRIARLHGGDIPKEADAVWKQAMATARARVNERQREASLCAPQVLAELMRRRGDKAVSLETLARRMHTSDQGTSLDALASVAKQSGWKSAEGFELTGNGLTDKMSNAGKNGAVVALVELGLSGHFVLVDKVASDGDVTVWDGNGDGLNRAAMRTYSATQWRKIWSSRQGQTGLALVLK